MCLSARAAHSGRSSCPDGHLGQGMDPCPISVEPTSHMDTSDTRGSGPSTLAGSMLSATVPALADLLVD